MHEVFRIQICNFLGILDPDQDPKIYKKLSKDSVRFMVNDFYDKGNLQIASP